MKTFAWGLTALAWIAGCTISDGTGPAPMDYQSLIDLYAADSAIPGVVALVARGDSVWSGASGDAELSGRLMTTHHKVRIGSLTKTFTATIVLQMVEEGVLGLDETIVPFFDWALVESLVVIDGQSYGHRVTIRMLLSHRSGIPDYADEGFSHLIHANPLRRWEPLDLVRYAYRHGRPPCIPDALPANEIAYSNTNYILLGMIVEQLEGRPFHLVLRYRILNPLRLQDTFLAEYEPIPSPLAHGYDGNTDVSWYDYSFEWASAGLVSTVGDVRRFMSALMGGELFRSPSTLETMKNPNGYGLGLASAVSADGAVGFGHLGQSLGFVAVMMHVPSRQTTVVAAMNQRSADIARLYFDLLSMAG